MARHRRLFVAGGTYFFTVCLARRGGDLLVREVGALREAVRATRAERPFGIGAFVVLPDHLYCVWTLPEGDSDFPVRWRLIKARFSRAVPMAERRPSQIVRRERGVWQRRYWEHAVRDEDDYTRCVEYCWTNPVKHGFVGDPKDWRWSSFHRDHP